MLKNSSDRYSNVAIGLHWLMLLLIAAVYACIELREFYPKGSDPREALKTLHFMLGLTVLLFVILRLAVRLSNQTPAITPALPVWQRRFAGLVHLALYVLMLGMPIGGWLILSAAGKPIPFFGLTLPPLVGENKELSKLIKEVHETVGVVGYWLIGLHALAAIYHHAIARDNTLLRMLPQRRPR